MIRLFTFLMILVVAGSVNAQDSAVYVQDSAGRNFTRFVTPEGDTIFTASLAPVTVLERREFKTDLEKSNFRKLQKNMKVVYPYALMAKEIYDGLQEDLSSIDKRRQRKKFKKEQEEQLKAEFETKLKGLTTTQGKLLVMLINRYTGNNCYGLIKELKGGMAAFGWNMVGKRWGYDLKAPYIASENSDIEFIIRQMELEQANK